MTSSDFRPQSIQEYSARFLARVLSALRGVLRAGAATLPYALRLGDQHREVTEQYPDPISSRTADDLPPGSRGLLFNDVEVCTGCGDCVKICPTRAILLETEPGADKSKLWVSRFEIDFSRCVFCGLCTEVCMPQSLTHSRQYESAAYERTDLVAHFGRGQVTEEQRMKWAAIRRMTEFEEGSGQ